MKKHHLLNAPISELVARLGHGDEICIADAGLPIPDNVLRIDLALVRSVPSFLQTFEALTSEMMVEQAVIATEFSSSDTDVYKDLLSAMNTLADTQNNGIDVRDISHEAFKIQTRQCKAVIRTGECTPYANVILRAGVSF